MDTLLMKDALLRCYLLADISSQHIEPCGTCCQWAGGGCGGAKSYLGVGGGGDCAAELEP